MEKQVFSLSDVRSRSGLILMLVVYVPVLSLMALAGSDSHNPLQFYVPLLCLVFMLLAYPARLWFDRVSKLEVTDGGLLLIRWLRKPVSMDWTSISSVRLTMEPVPFGGGRYYDPAALIRETSGRKILIPGTCRSAKEIVGILKERLPERVFETRWRKFF